MLAKGNHRVHLHPTGEIDLHGRLNRLSEIHNLAQNKGTSTDVVHIILRGDYVLRVGVWLDGSNGHDRSSLVLGTKTDENIF